MILQQKQLLETAGRIVRHNKELALAKGELFNIYNILNLKTKEVRTHSAFIAELLNPNGTHFLGTVFLEAFIKLLPSAYFKDHIKPKSSSVLVEFHTGAIDNDVKVGGRIDILIKDGSNNTIVIENKIDAGDQPFQIERYYNYNKNGNRVVYISKYGDSPDIKSKGKFIEGTNFHVLSYREDIIRWLNVCQSLANDQPILRESIKQYRILIQQITNTLGNQEDTELTNAVTQNLEEAATITAKYQQIRKRLRTNFKEKLLQNLKAELSEFDLTSNSIDSKHSHIWFYNKNLKGKEIGWFAVESFSGRGHQDGLLFVGIFDKKGQIPREDYFLTLNKQWIHHKPLMYNNSEIRLSDILFLKLINDSNQLTKIIENLTKQIINFISDYRHLLEKN